ncbi:MAG: type II toxin-antitoxin system VapC family toxin [Microbacteriaceae bacterium]|nr:type II toxin-antitoxin system VapC family toxin [Microbacteriaceae bacterium]
MIVLDTSAWVDLAIDGATPQLVDAIRSSGHWVVPEHFRTEAMNAIRGLWLGHKVTRATFDEAAAQLMTVDLDPWPTAPLIPRMQQLADNANAYDAAYVALAEELGCALVSSDAKFVRIPGIRCQVIGFE